MKRSTAVSRIIGLTGGIGSGKTTAARYLWERGAAVIHADQLGHRAYAPGTSVHRAIVDAFGETVVGDDGRIDRKALGASVFCRPEALKKLTDIVWPEIRRLAEAEIAAVRRDDPHAVVVLEAAVLFEAGWEDVVDEVWVAVVDEQTVLKRVVSRDGIDEEEVRCRIKAQLSCAEQIRRADVVFDNSGTEDDLKKLLDGQWRRFAPITARGKR